MKYEQMTTKEQQAIRMGGPVPIVATIDGEIVFENEILDDGTDRAVIDELGEEADDE